MSDLKLTVVLSLLISFNICAQNIEVDHASGKPIVQIPIYQLTSGDISVPVMVANSGNALKVTDSNGSCGVGWNLVADGSVTRSVRGLPDDYPGGAGDSRRGWLFDSNATTINNFSPGSDDNLAVCSDEVNDYNFINGLNYLKDPEPDLFFFQAPGLSGQFVFGTDGNPKLLTYQDLKIVVTKDGNGQIIKFTITTNVGVTYEFSQKETTTRGAEWHEAALLPSYFQSDFKYYRQRVTYHSAWKLDLIKSPSGGIVNFTYTDLDETSSSKFYTTINASNYADTIYYLNDKFSPKRLSQIDAGLMKADFSWHKDVVSNIKISEDFFDEEKRFDFVYTSAAASLDPDYQDTWGQQVKQFLMKIKQSDNCVSFPDYSFEYQSKDPGNFFHGLSDRLIYFSSHKLIRMDIWEYFNDSHPGKIPTVYYYASQTGSERFRTEPISGSTPTSIISGDNRQVSGTLYTSAFGALTKITYPTGGYSEITYEPHRYFDAVANADYYAGGARVKSILTIGGELAFGSATFQRSSIHAITKEYEYLRADGKSSGKLLYHPVFAFTDGTNTIRTVASQSPESQEVIYTNVTEKIAGKGKVVYEFNVPAMYPSVTDGNWKATSSKIARKPGGSCIPYGNIKNGSNTFPFAPNTNYDFERAIPSRIAEYAEDNTLVKELLFTYTRNPSTFTTVKGLRYEQIGDVFHFGLYDIITGTTKVPLTETTKVVDDLSPGNFATSSVTYSYSTTHAMLQTVTHQNSNGDVHREKIKYAKDFAAITSPLWSAARGVSALNTSNQHGAVVERIQTVTPAGGTETVTGSQFFLYKDFGNGKVLLHRTFSFPQNATLTESSVTGSNQYINYDSLDYLPVKTIEKYDMKGNVLNQRDNNKNIASSHYGFGNTIPVAMINNALPNEVVYSGFETTTGFEWTPGASPTPAYTAGWTGEKALTLTSAMTLQKNNVDKNVATSIYRISCWVKAATAATITFKILNSSTVVSTATLNYAASPANAWKYLEGTISLAGAPAVFNTQVVTNATVSIDDILLIPSTASVNFKTYLPLTGVTSVTDDRGNSVAYQYDPLGRLANTYDRYRNLVELKEYQYQLQPVQPVTAAFTPSVSYYQIYKGTAVVFTPAANCVSPVTYSWKVNGVVVSTASTLTQTFNTLGSQLVELTVVAPNGTATHAEDFCVEPHSLTLAITPQGGNVIDKCDVSYNKTFTVLLTPLSDCANPDELKYEWFYDSGVNWIPIDYQLGPESDIIEFNISNYGTPRSYQIKCKISGKCSETSPSCIATHDVSGTQIISITYNNPPQACP